MASQDFGSAGRCKAANRGVWKGDANESDSFEDRIFM